MRVLFIGGTGNISAECAALLHRAGHAILIASRGRTRPPAQYTAFSMDRKDPAQLRSVASAANADVVLNFIGYDLQDVQADYEAFSGKTGQYVFISSTTVHARPPRLPITEDAPLGNAFWEYARKKAECEAWLLQQWRTKDFPVTIVRPSHTYSNRWIPNGIASSNHAFAARLRDGSPVFVHDNGETPWTLTHSSDFAAGLAGLLGLKKAVGETFQITSDEVLSWNAIYAEIATALGAPVPQIVRIPTGFICEIVPSLTGTLKGDKAYPGVFDNSKLRRFVPGFACKKTFAQGMRESVEWLREDPTRWRIDSGTAQLIENVLARWASR